MTCVHGVMGRSAAVAAVVLAVGCTTPSNDPYGSPTVTAPVGKAETPAAALRQGLDSLMQEHVVLTCSETEAALAGRTEEFNAVSIALNDNRREMEGAIRSIYGDDAGTEFYNLCNNHDGYLVDYTQGITQKDEAKRNKAVADLLTFANDFGTYIQKITGGHLAKDTVADLIRGDVSSVKGVIDAQAAGDFDSAYTKERDAEKQIFVLGNTLTNTIVEQFPAKY